SWPWGRWRTSGARRNSRGDWRTCSSRSPKARSILMSDVAALASLKWVELRNRASLFGQQSRFKIVVVVVFSAAFWVTLFQLFYSGMSFLQKTALQYNFSGLIGAMFYIFFFALTVMLTFSNAIIGYSSYFKSKETGFLLAAPVRAESIFLYKF